MVRQAYLDISCSGLWMFLVRPCNEDVPEHRPPLKKKPSRSINSYIIHTTQLQKRFQTSGVGLRIKPNKQIDIHTNRIRRDFPFSHKRLGSVMKFLLHQIIIYVNVKPTHTQQTHKKGKWTKIKNLGIDKVTNFLANTNPLTSYQLPNYSVP